MKKALVTGASKGIGSAFAHKLASKGYQVTAIARNESLLKKLMNQLGKVHRYIVTDLTDSDSLKKVCEDVAREGYDVLVNNAGLGGFGRFEKIPLEKHQYMMQLNCNAVFTLTHVYLQNAENGDALIDVSSALGVLAFPHQSMYAATKAFVVSLSESLWHENKKRGVYVVALCPGPVYTDFMITANGENVKPPAFLWKKPEEVVENTLDALKAQSKPTLFPGIGIKAMVWTSKKLMNRKGMVNMMGTFYPDED